MKEYQCKGKCQKKYYSSMEYSELEKVIKKNNMCCSLPIWYSEEQQLYMLKNHVIQLSKDYSKFKKDLLIATQPKTIDDVGQLYFDFRKE